jgi:hypothetical protein
MTAEVAQNKRNDDEGTQSDEGRTYCLLRATSGSSATAAIRIDERRYSPVTYVIFVNPAFRAA